MHELKRVVVVGAGTMGSQIALQTALSGRYDVALVDTVAGQLERASGQNRKLLDRSVEKGRLTGEAADQAFQRIAPSDDLASAAGEADLVIEAVIEDFAAKKGVFEALGKHAGMDTILASNSSTIAISRLADFTGRPERCCNMHFFHPVTVMQLCEVVRGPKTSDETVVTAMEFVRSIGRTPVLLKKEIWGFIVNRILFAASEEAMRLLDDAHRVHDRSALRRQNGRRLVHALHERHDVLHRAADGGARRGAVRNAARHSAMPRGSGPDHDVGTGLPAPPFPVPWRSGSAARPAHPRPGAGRGCK